MRLLLDSHVALWWLINAPQLGSTAIASIDAAEIVAFSPATPWELGIKRSIGKLSYPGSIAAELERIGFVELPIRSRHAEAAAELPGHHRDPFDRLLIAQAQIEGLTLVTADDALAPYQVDRLDARR